MKRAPASAVVHGGPHDGSVVLYVPLDYYRLEAAKRRLAEMQERVDALEAEMAVRALVQVCR